MIQPLEPGEMLLAAMGLELLVDTMKKSVAAGEVSKDEGASIVRGACVAWRKLADNLARVLPEEAALELRKEPNEDMEEGFELG